MNVQICALYIFFLSIIVMLLGIRNLIFMMSKTSVKIYVRGQSRPSDSRLNTYYLAL